MKVSSIISPCLSFLLPMLMLVAVCEGKEKEKKISPYDALKPLKALDRGARYTLKVGYLELEGYPSLGSEERRQYETHVEKASLQYLGFKVDLEEAWVKPAGEVYDRFRKEFKRTEVKDNLAYDIHDGNLKALGEVAERLAKKHGKDKIREYLLMDSGEIIHNPEESLLQQSHDLFKKFSQLKSEQGKPLLDLKASRFHSYNVLNAIQVFIEDVDLLVVNQLICLPDQWMPLYCMARGGVTTGAVEDNHHRPYGGTAFMSLYPFMAKDALFTKLNPIPDDRRLEVAAVYTTHELGHLLGRREELYDHEGCVSKAATGLNYWEWFKGVEGKTCVKEHPTLKTF